MSARPWEFFIRAFFARASIYFQLSSTLVKWSLCQSIYVYASRSTSSRVLSVWTPCSFFEGGGFWMSLFGRADISSAMSQAVRMSLSVVFLHSRRFIFSLNLINILWYLRLSLSSFSYGISWLLLSVLSDRSSQFSDLRDRWYLKFSISAITFERIEIFWLFFRHNYVKLFIYEDK